MTLAHLRITLAALAVATIAFSAPAQARHHHYRHYSHHHRHYYRHTDRMPAFAHSRAPMRYSRSTHSQVASSGAGVIGGRPSGCPHAYCGCEASRYIFGRIIAELNLAANWFRFPRSEPAPGMAAVRRHHVFIILSVNGDGTVMAHDGNSGRGLTREHVVSLRGYTVVNPHGARYASK